MIKHAAVIIPAAGSGTRMKLGYPKQYHRIGDAPILVHTLRPFLVHPLISEIVLVVPEQEVENTQMLLALHQVSSSQIIITGGGARRQDSVHNGLQKVDPSTQVVLVHDGARPLVDADIIDRCYEGALQKGAVIAAVPVKDTLKRGNDADEIVSTVDRENLWQAQTPQAARYALLANAFKEFGHEDVTDESMLLERAGHKVHLIEGSDTNIKVTRPDDIALVESLLIKSLENTAIKPQEKDTMKMRIGHGYDAHRFAENRKLVLGGIEIPYHLGLAGHSDADVLTHALCDALLGAIGAGDIGKHFPDNDGRFKDIYSIKLLEQVIEFIKEKNFSLVNADITLVCQAPKLAPFLPKMITVLAMACQTEEEHINIKATTTEKMGFTGRGEGISCHAVVLLQG